MRGATVCAEYKADAWRTFWTAALLVSLCGLTACVVVGMRGAGVPAPGLASVVNLDSQHSGAVAGPGVDMPVNMTALVKEGSK
jgi:hypothetical protein